MAEKKKVKRVEIPPEIVNEALFLSDNTCCVCREPRKDVQTHHIDEDPSNSLDINNIAILCLQCHNDTMTTGGFGRKLTAKLVIKYRDDWYKTIKKKRENAITILAPETSKDTYYDDLDEVELNDHKTRTLHKRSGTKFAYSKWKKAIEKYLDLNSGEQKVLAKILKDFRNDNELDIPKIIRKNNSFIYDISSLKNNVFLSFHCGWEYMSMDSDGFTTDPNEDITLAVGIKEGWSLTHFSKIINEIYLYFGEDKQTQFNDKLHEETC